MNGKDATEAKGKTKTHWKEWEIGCLIGRSLEGVPLDVIADGMGRTRSACRTMLGRLINGDVECEEDADAEALEKLREQNHPKTHPTKHDDRQNVEQYRTLAKSIEAAASRLAGIENAVVYLLATKIVEGCIPVAEISRFCPLAFSRNVLQIVGVVNEHRKLHPELFDKPECRNTGGPVDRENGTTDADKPSALPGDEAG